MRVGFQDVADSVAISGYEGEESGGRGSVDGGCGGRVVEDRVDDDAGVGWRVGDDVLEGSCCGLEKGVDGRLKSCVC